MNKLLILIDKETGKEIAQYNLSEITTMTNLQFLREDVIATVEVEKDGE